MSPRQGMLMVAASAALLALVGGLLAVPSGLALDRVLNDLISSSAGMTPRQRPTASSTRWSWH